jgi:hypothetical protein
MKMAVKAILTLFFRPSSIAIHDDRNMTGKFFRIDMILEGHVSKINYLFAIWPSSLFLIH